MPQSHIRDVDGMDRPTETERPDRQRKMEKVRRRKRELSVPDRRRAPEGGGEDGTKLHLKLGLSQSSPLSRSFFLVFLEASGLSISTLQRADNVSLRPQHPQTHIEGVQKLLSRTVPSCSVPFCTVLSFTILSCTTQASQYPVSLFPVLASTIL